MTVGQPRSAAIGHPGAVTRDLSLTDLPDIATNVTASGLWSVVVGLADGRTVVVSEIQEGVQPSRSYGLLYSANGALIEAFFGADIDPTAALPVRVRLPNGLGWVVADRGATLRYADINGTWHDVGTDAALLPPDTVSVEVRRGVVAGTVALVP